MPESFHFLRPAWLLALLPLALVLWAASRSAERATAWRRVVDAHLLRHLVVAGEGRAQRWPLWLGALAGVATCVALAGPTWERIPQPTFRNVEPTVVVLDMSATMAADDLDPSRLTRARYKLQDILDRTHGGQVGLVLYTDEPFVAAPLTDDGRVIAAMLPSLESGLMPLRPARPDRAIAQAKALLDQAGAAGGRVILVADGLDGHAAEATAAARELAASGRTLSVLGAGTTAGAPLRDARGRVVEGADGKPERTRLDRDGLAALAAAGGGRFSELRPDDRDLASLVPARPTGVAKAQQPGSSAQFDLWRDAGIWLVLVPLALAPLAFRRGLVAALAVTLLVATSGRAEASTWSDLWSRPDQQGAAALSAGKPAEAAKLFAQPDWKAAADYQSGDYAASAASYAKLAGTENQYNLGNALARSGKLEDAVGAYDRVLAQEPRHADAKFNRDLVKHLLDERKKQQEQQQQGEKQAQQGGQGGGKQDSRSQQSAGKDRDQANGGAQQNGQQGNPGDQQQQQQQNAARDGSGGAAAHQDGAQAKQPEKPAQGQQAKDEPQQGGGAATAPQHDAATQKPDDAQQAAAATGRQDQHAPQAANAGASSATPPDAAQDGASARANDERDQAAKQDRSLAQGVDHALQEGGGDAQPKRDGDARGSADAHRVQRPLSEQDQAREQALRNIPDDPGGLLRAKIRRQYAERRYSQQEAIPSW